MRVQHGSASTPDSSVALETFIEQLARRLEGEQDAHSKAGFVLMPTLEQVSSIAEAVVSSVMEPVKHFVEAQLRGRNAAGKGAASTIVEPSPTVTGEVGDLPETLHLRTQRAATHAHRSAVGHILMLYAHLWSRGQKISRQFQNETMRACKQREIFITRQEPSTSSGESSSDGDDDTSIDNDGDGAAGIATAAGQLAGHRQSGSSSIKLQLQHHPQRKTRAAGQSSSGRAALQSRADWHHTAPSSSSNTATRGGSARGAKFAGFGIGVGEAAVADQHEDSLTTASPSATCPSTTLLSQQKEANRSSKSVKRSRPRPSFTRATQLLAATAASPTQIEDTSASWGQSGRLAWARLPLHTIASLAKGPASTAYRATYPASGTAFGSSRPWHRRIAWPCLLLEDTPTPVAGGTRVAVVPFGFCGTSVAIKAASGSQAKSAGPVTPVVGVDAASLEELTTAPVGDARATLLLLNDHECDLLATAVTEAYAAHMASGGRVFAPATASLDAQSLQPSPAAAASPAASVAYRLPPQARFTMFASLFLAGAPMPFAPDGSAYAQLEAALPEIDPAKLDALLTKRLQRISQAEALPSLTFAGASSFLSVELPDALAVSAPSSAAAAEPPMSTPQQQWQQSAQGTVPIIGLSRAPDDAQELFNARSLFVRAATLGPQPAARWWASRHTAGVAVNDLRTKAPAAHGSSLDHGGPSGDVAWSWPPDVVFPSPERFDDAVAATTQRESKRLRVARLFEPLVATGVAHSNRSAERMVPQVAAVPARRHGVVPRPLPPSFIASPRQTIVKRMEVCKDSGLAAIAMAGLAEAMPAIEHTNGHILAAYSAAEHGTLLLHVRDLFQVGGRLHGQRPEALAVSGNPQTRPSSSSSSSASSSAAPAPASASAPAPATSSSLFSARSSLPSSPPAATAVASAAIPDGWRRSRGRWGRLSATIRGGTRSASRGGRGRGGTGTGGRGTDGSGRAGVGDGREGSPALVGDAAVTAYQPTGGWAGEPVSATGDDASIVSTADSRQTSRSESGRGRGRGQGKGRGGARGRGGGRGRGGLSTTSSYQRPDAAMFRCPNCTRSFRTFPQLATHARDHELAVLELSRRSAIQENRRHGPSHP